MSRRYSVGAFAIIGCRYGESSGINMVGSDEFRSKIANFLKISPERVREDAVLTELITDSFALVDMVVELQEVYRSRLTQEDLKEVRTVKDLHKQLCMHMQEAAPDNQ